MPQQRARTGGASQAHRDERRALDELFANRYEELRRIASTWVKTASEDLAVVYEGMGKLDQARAFR